jgi:hypothetical protein
MNEVEQVVTTTKARKLAPGIRTRTGRAELYMDVVCHGRRIARSLGTTNLADAVKEKDRIVARAVAAFRSGGDVFFCVLMCCKM